MISSSLYIVMESHTNLENMI